MSYSKKQYIGNITNSKDINIKQNMHEANKQTVGDIHNSQKIEVIQRSDKDNGSDNRKLLLYSMIGSICIFLIVVMSLFYIYRKSDKDLLFFLVFLSLFVLLVIFPWIGFFSKNLSQKYIFRFWIKTVEKIFSVFKEKIDK